MTLLAVGVDHRSAPTAVREALAFAEVAEGRLPPRIINPEAVPRFAARWEAAFGRPMATAP